MCDPTQRHTATNHYSDHDASTAANNGKVAAHNDDNLGANNDDNGAANNDDCPRRVVEYAEDHGGHDGESR